MKRMRSVCLDCLLKNKNAILFLFVTAVINGALFLLYDVMMEPFLYAGVLLLFFLLLLLCVDFYGEWKAAKEREACKNGILAGGTNEVGKHALRDEDYAEMLEILTARIGRLQEEYFVKCQGDTDYYTAWVHQIKTPIATMRLLLDQDDEKDRALSAELFRIEQYVGMVLDYIRLGGETNDLLIKEYPLDDLIRETLRKFAPQFIMRKLRLSYEPTDEKVVTDKKWMTFILEQIISNAIKYTPEGEISIAVQDGCIVIGDTGIGIASEDLPRIFEKGYTGVNGRLGQKSSGLGLFLTKKAADLIAVSVTCESQVGHGSTFRIKLPHKA